MSEQFTVENASAGAYFEKTPPFPADATVTMAYVPFQCDATRYDDDRALEKGTLFKGLDKPFLRGAIR